MTNQEKLKGKYIRYVEDQENPVAFLESIGGKVEFSLTGDSENIGYFINNYGMINCCIIVSHPTITVNEAKALLNESDLKVGDWVKSTVTNMEGKLLAILPDDYSLKYIVANKELQAGWLACESVTKIKIVTPSKQDIANLMGLPVDSIDFSKL